MSARVSISSAGGTEADAGPRPLSAFAVAGGSPAARETLTNDGLMALLFVSWLAFLDLARLEECSASMRRAARRFADDAAHRAGMDAGAYTNMAASHAAACVDARRNALRRGRALATGSVHSLVVDGAGRVHAFGHGAHGRLGLGAACTSTCTPRAVHFAVHRRGSPPRFSEGPRRSIGAAVRIAQVAAARRHSVALAVGGAVFTWGGNARGQLGHSDAYDAVGLADVLEPRRVAHLFCGGARVVEIACGDDHTLLLDSNGRLRACGAADVVGVEEEGVDVHVPTLLWRLADKRIRVARIAACGSHSLALTDAGAIYSWGHGAGGRLGHGDDVPRGTPSRVRALEGVRVMLIDCGAECSCAIAVDRLWWWGVENALSYLSDFDDADARWRTPTPCALPKGEVSALSAGGGLAAAVSAPR